MTTDYGVTAEIDCPTVELTDIGDGGITYRSLRLIIHMTSGKLTYFDTSSSEKDDEDVSGWTVSWVAKIGSRNIQNIEEGKLVESCLSRRSSYHAGGNAPQSEEKNRGWS